MQKKDITEIRDSSRDPSNAEVPYGSNCVRLSPCEWLIVGIVFSAVLCLGPTVWQCFEKFEPAPDCRLPYELSSDYWLYNRYCRWACSRYETLVIGDSVIWGHFVPKERTLSHYLNELAGREHFVNLGVDGIHPAALDGLLRHYGRVIKGKNVILHFNPLWMISKKHDLQWEKEHHFDHPKLVPQFTPRIPCYRNSFSDRIGIVIEHYVPLLSWQSHLNITYFQSMDVRDIPAWTVAHPYENPLKAVSRQLPASEYFDPNEHISWTQAGIAKDGTSWVDLETSLQWMFFRRSVEMLKKRGNNVFVLVGPFNEHMLKPENLEKYTKIKGRIEAWLQQNNIPRYIPPALPSDFYRDASHPLSDGYAVLAKQLFKNELFRSSILCSERRVEN